MKPHVFSIGIEILSALASVHAAKAAGPTLADTLPVLAMEAAFQALSPDHEQRPCTDAIKEPDYCQDLASVVCDKVALARIQAEEKLFLEESAKLAAQKAEQTFRPSSQLQCSVTGPREGSFTMSSDCLLPTGEDNDRLRKFQEQIRHLETLGTVKPSDLEKVYDQTYRLLSKLRPPVQVKSEDARAQSISERISGFAPQSSEKSIDAQYVSASKWLSGTLIPTDLMSRIMSQQISDADRLPNIDYLLFQNSCGKSGSDQNAFFDPRRKQLVFCPGLSLTNNPVSASFVMGHEVAHSFFEDIPQAAKDSMIGCLQSQYGEIEEKLEDKLSEIVPDLYGIEVLTNLLREKNATSEEALSKITEATRFLCRESEPVGHANKASSDSHPSGRFRIQVIVGRNPEVLRLLGCSPNQAKRPYCGLKSFGK